MLLITLKHVLTLTLDENCGVGMWGEWGQDLIRVKRGFFLKKMILVFHRIIGKLIYF